eukprot:jgi/Mesen1/10485/ME000083S09986
MCRGQAKVGSCRVVNTSSERRDRFKLLQQAVAEEAHACSASFRTLSTILYNSRRCHKLQKAVFVFRNMTVLQSLPARTLPWSLLSHIQDCRPKLLSQWTPTPSCIQLRSMNLKTDLVGHVALSCDSLLRSAGISSQLLPFHETKRRSAVEGRRYWQSRRKRGSMSVSAQPSAREGQQADVEELKKMRVKEIKAELEALGVSFADCFEKADLVLRLAEARLASVSKAASPPQATKDVAVLRLPMRRIKSSAAEPKEYLLLQLTFGSRGTFDFLVDTGSSTTLVTSRLAYDILGISRGSGVMSQGLGGTGTTGGRQVMLPDVRVGSCACGPLQAIVMDLGNTSLGPSVYGIVGINLLSLFDFDLDFKRSSMALYRAGAVAAGAVDFASLRCMATASVPYGLPALQVTVNGVSTKAILDMGSALSLVSWKTARAGGVSPDSPNVRPALRAPFGIDGTTTRSSDSNLDICLLSTGGSSRNLMFKQAPMVIADIPALVTMGAGMILGLDLIGRGRLVLCFSKNTVYMDT